MDTSSKSSAAEKVKAYTEAKRTKFLEDAADDSALLCLYYPQYTLEDANNITPGELVRMLRVAKREKQQDRLIALAIAGSAQEEKSYKKLHRDFKKGLDRLK